MPMVRREKHLEISLAVSLSSIAKIRLQCYSPLIRWKTAPVAFVFPAPGEGVHGRRSAGIQFARGPRECSPRAFARRLRCDERVGDLSYDFDPTMVGLSQTHGHQSCSRFSFPFLFLLFSVDNNLMLLWLSLWGTWLSASGCPPRGDCKSP